MVKTSGRDGDTTKGTRSSRSLASKHKAKYRLAPKSPDRHSCCAEEHEPFSIYSHEPLIPQPCPPLNLPYSTHTLFSTSPHHPLNTTEQPIYNSARLHPFTMASKILAPSMRAFRQTSTLSPFRTFRTFQSSARLRDATATTIPVRKPVGAFRGGMFGFLLGSTLAGAGTYYYILEEYKVSNELLTEDIYVSRDSIDELYERVAV